MTQERNSRPLAAHVSGRARSRPLTHRLIGLAAVATLALLGAVAIDASAAGASSHTYRNLVADPAFKHGTRAWTVTKGARLTVRRVHGHRVLAIRNLTRHPLTVSLNDRRNTVRHTVAGMRYTAAASVRIAHSSVTAAVREGAWRGSTSRSAPRLRSVWLRNTHWHRVRVSFHATRNGDSIDFNVLAWRLPPHVTFFVARLSLVATVAPSAPAQSSPSRGVEGTPGQSPPGSSGPGQPGGPSSPPPSDPPSSDPGSPADRGNLVFDDEFSGTSVDRSKWNVRNNSWASNEESIDTSRSSNVFEGDGMLTIRAQREQYTAYGTTRSYTSGYLDTIGLASQQYGHWEMRAKLPTAKGMWPAFWLRSDHSPGEIDILEAIGGLSQMTVQTVFPNTNDGSVKRSHEFDVPDTIGAWHVYGFTWTPTSMSWEIDGATVFKLTSGDASWVATGFNDTMNIRLNLQVGGSMPKYFNKEVDSSTALPADYQIDYVRVYDR